MALIKHEAWKRGKAFEFASDVDGGEYSSSSYFSCENELWHGGYAGNMFESDIARCVAIVDSAIVNMMRKEG